MAMAISEVTRLKIALASSVLSLICIIPSMMLFSAGFYIQVAVQTKIRLIEGLDVAALPGCIITVGFLSAIYNSLSGAVVFLSRRKKKRESFTRYLFPIVITGLALFLAIFILGLACFMQINHLSNSFQKGINIAMSKYKSNMDMKEEIDVLQIDYRCCGSSKYTDWFNISWMNKDQSGHKAKEAEKVEFLHDNVPFSCCDPSSVRPCIHQHVHGNDHHHRYDYRMALTLHKVGCRDALVSFYGHNMLVNVGAVIVSISFLQIVAVILTRIVQTSMLNAIENDDPFGPAVGYIFFNENVSTDHTPMTPIVDDYDDFFTDTTFDDVSTNVSADEREHLIANEPLYANVGTSKAMKTPGPMDKKSEHIYDYIYEVSYSGGPPPASDVNQGGPAAHFPFRAQSPGVPQFPAPAAPITLSPSPHQRLIPSVNNQYN